MNKLFGNLLVIIVFVFVLAAAAKAETYYAYLTSAQEVPSNASAGRGYARIVYDPATKNFTLTGAYSGMSSAVNASHIHGSSAIGVNSAVLFNLTNTGGISGTLSGSGTLTTAQETDLRAHLFYVDLHTVNFSAGEVRGQIGAKRPVDFDGDGRTDYSVLRFPNVAPPAVAQITYYNSNSTTGLQYLMFGDANTDFPAPGDYDGDGRDDITVFRPGANAGDASSYIIYQSSNNTVRYVPWGIKGDQTVARDYDGDGITDLAVFRVGAVTGAPAYWYIRQSSNGALRAVQFGTTSTSTSGAGDAPVPADYDGDGKFDIAIYRHGGINPDNTFIVLRSSNSVVTYFQWGDYNTDYIAPGDYDGDGKADYCAVRSGANPSSPLIWYILQSSNGQFRAQYFGISSDLLVQGDYDGDARTDLAVYRRGATATSSSLFYVSNSLGNVFSATTWGLRADFPVASFDAH